MYINNNFLQEMYLSGDSFMLRLGRHLRNDQCRSPADGLCQSGAVITAVAKRLKNFQMKEHSCPIVVMAGTNDILKTRTGELSVENLIFKYNKILQYCTKKTSKVVVCTIPPIPIIGYHGSKFLVWKNFNRYLMGLDGSYGGTVKVARVDKIFFNYKKKRYIPELYQQQYPSGRPDWLHWNVDGMEKVQNTLRSVLIEHQ